MHADSEFELSELVVGSGTVGKTVTKKKFWILDFVVLVNSLGFT